MLSANQIGEPVDALGSPVVLEENGDATPNTSTAPTPAPDSVSPSSPTGAPGSPTAGDKSADNRSVHETEEAKPHSYIPGLNLEDSIELTSEERDEQFRRQGTMNYEPSQNIRTRYGRYGPDSRTLLENVDTGLHFSPRSCDYHPTMLSYALDADGMPLQYRGTAEHPQGILLTPEDMATLEAENPDVLRPFQRVRAAEWRWKVSRRRVPSILTNWLSYIALCGDAPGRPIDEAEWPGRQVIDDSRKPPCKYSKENDEERVKAKEESAAQKEFKKATFEMITKDTGGKLSRENAIVLATLWGYVPSELDKKRFLEKSGGEDVTQKELMFWIKHSLLHPEDLYRREIKAAFAAVSKGDWISEFAFKTLLMNYGEVLTEAEVSEVLAQTNCRVKMPDGTVKINYNDFVEELWSQNRKLPVATAYTHLGCSIRSLPPMVETEAAHF